MAGGRPNVSSILYISGMKTITYKRKLKMTRQQQQRVDSWIGACRYVYNLALETRIEAWKKQKSIGKYELMKQLPPLKEVDWIADVPSQSLQNVIERLDVAYQKFFSGGGFPRWAAKHRYSSILFKSVQVEGNTITLPKLGAVRTFKDRFVHGTPKTATVIREHDGYYICITTRIGQYPIRLASESQAVGLDIGIAHFCVSSSGKYTANPRHFAKYERQLRIANRSLARKKKYSANWYKQKANLTCLHAKIGRVRKDFLHQQSWQVVRDNGLIAVEDLKVKNMVRRRGAAPRLAKHISDAGWAMFRNQLAYKSDWHGRTLVSVDPKYTSQTCSECGHKEKDNRLSQAKFVCLSCRVEQNADVNAAKNILARALASVSQREALACA